MGTNRTNSALPACGQTRTAGPGADPDPWSSRVRRCGRAWRPPTYAAVCLGVGTLYLHPAPATAQEAEPRPRRATLAYFGERIVQPGLRLGYEGAALFRQPHELLLAGNVAGFAVSGGYALMVLFEGGYRVTAPFGGFLDLRPGIGYTAAWIDNDGLTQVSNYFTLSGLGGIGYDFYRRLRVPISLMARSGVFWRAGTGPVEGVSYALDVGIAYQFGTGRPKPPTLPVSFPPPAEAPSNLDDPSALEGKPPEPPPLPPPPLYPGPPAGSLQTAPLAPLAPLPSATSPPSAPLAPLPPAPASLPTSLAPLPPAAPSSSTPPLR